MSKHTPGPWHRNIRGDGRYPTIFAGRNTHVAAASGHGKLPPDVIEANIDLIAAAPQLLDALEKMLEVQVKRRHPLGDPDEGIAYEAAAAEASAREAIDLARGKTNAE